MSGRFISFEGGEGAGKTTQVTLLAERLTAEGCNVVTTREPGGTSGAEAIRALFVNGEPDRWDATTEVLLINAARADHVARLIRPALQSGSWVICDRYIDSTLAYQGAGKGVPRAVLLDQHRLATENLWPDLTLVLDLPVEIGAGRAAGRHGGESRFEAHDAGFHARVAASFAALADEDPRRVRSINATGDAKAVAAAIWKEVLPLLRS